MPTPPERSTDDPRLAGLTPRDRLVRAGQLELLDLPLHKALAGFTTARVAGRAGVTTGSFFHHFANAKEFADALALSYVELPDDVGEAIEEINEALHDIDLLDIMRGSLTDSWQIFHADPVMPLSFRVQMQLWAHHDQPLSEPCGDYRTVSDILRHSYRLRQQEATAVWAELLERTGRKIVPPFTLDELATTLNALFQGLIVRAAVDPEAVPDEMFAEVAVALGAALTVPRGSTLRLADLTRPLLDESRLSPQARSGARRRRETRARISAAAVDLFEGGWESVSATDVAEAAGVSTQTVINLFRSVRAVAASVFARHVPEIRRASFGDDGASEDPLDRLEATLRCMAEAVSADPEPARALLGERADVNLHRGGELTEHDIRIEVPIAEPVLRCVEELDIDGHEPIDLSRTLIDFILCQTLGRPNREAETAATALRLLPDSALGGRDRRRRVA